VLLSNLADVPSERTDEIVASQGHIICGLYAGGSSSHRVERFVWRNDHDPTYVRVLNVNCSIYPKNHRQTDTLERAIRRLPGVSDLPSALPSKDAVSD
jgi:hypothetical protein